MPTFEFECEKCGAVWDEVCRFNEDEKGKKCPECGEPKPKKSISVFNRGYGKGCAPRQSG